MKMKSCTAAILLLISLQAVVDGHLSAAATGDDLDTIRLPSHGLADEVMAAARKSGGVKRPWNCCDTRECTVGCPRLEGVAAAAAATEDASPPWKCCDKSWCTRSMPPICHCNDEVKMCAKTCKNCEKVVGSKGASTRYVCRDTYGKVAPQCTNMTVAAADVRRGAAVSGDETKAVEAATAGPRLLNSTDQFSTGKAETVSEKSVADGEEDASPWKCCDKSWCTRSMPPICHCNDEVKKCAKTCKVCEKADGTSNAASSRYICRDSYGKVAPPCTKTVATDASRGN